jgi:hypothetical protein
MAGTRTARESFTGDRWSDDDGTTYEIEHEGRLVRLRFLDGGRVALATQGEPLLLGRCALGSGVIEAGQWQNVHLYPQRGR